MSEQSVELNNQQTNLKLRNSNISNLKISFNISKAANKLKNNTKIDPTHLSDNKLETLLHIIQKVPSERQFSEINQLKTYFKKLQYIQKLSKKCKDSQLNYILDHFCKQIKYEHVSKGDILYKEGESNINFYVLLDGQASLLQKKNEDQILQEQIQCFGAKPSQNEEAKSPTKIQAQRGSNLLNSPLKRSSLNINQSPLQSSSPTSPSKQQTDDQIKLLRRQSKQILQLDPLHQFNKLGQQQQQQQQNSQNYNFQETSPSRQSLTNLRGFTIKPQNLNSQETSPSRKSFNDLRGFTIKPLRADQIKQSDSEENSSENDDYIDNEEIQIKIANINLNKQIRRTNLSSENTIKLFQQQNQEVIIKNPRLYDKLQIEISRCLGPLQMSQLKHKNYYFTEGMFKFSYGMIYHSGDTIGSQDILKKKQFRSETVLALTELHIGYLTFKEYLHILHEYEEAKFNNKYKILSVIMMEKFEDYKNTLGSLVPFMSKQKFVSGQTIFHQGDSIEGIYVIKTGQVEISRKIGLVPPKEFLQKFQHLRIIPKYSDILLCTLTENQYLGEDEIIKQENSRLFSAKAISSSTLYFIPKEQFQNVLSNNTDLLQIFLKKLASKLNWQNQKIKDTSLLLQREYEIQFVKTQDSDLNLNLKPQKKLHTEPNNNFNSNNDNQSIQSEEKPVYHTKLIPKRPKNKDLAFYFKFRDTFQQMEHNLKENQRAKTSKNPKHRTQIKGLSENQTLVLNTDQHLENPAQIKQLLSSRSLSTQKQKIVLQEPHLSNALSHDLIRKKKKLYKKMLNQKRSQSMTQRNQLSQQQIKYGPSLDQIEEKLQSDPVLRGKVYNAVKNFVTQQDKFIKQKKSKSTFIPAQQNSSGSLPFHCLFQKVKQQITKDVEERIVTPDIRQKNNNQLMIEQISYPQDNLNQFKQLLSKRISTTSTQEENHDPDNIKDGKYNQKKRQSQLMLKTYNLYKIERLDTFQSQQQKDMQNQFFVRSGVSTARSNKRVDPRQKMYMMTTENSTRDQKTLNAFNIQTPRPATENSLLMLQQTSDKNQNSAEQKNNIVLISKKQIDNNDNNYNKPFITQKRHNSEQYIQPKSAVLQINNYQVSQYQPNQLFDHNLRQQSEKKFQKSLIIVNHLGQPKKYQYCDSKYG